MGIETIDGHDTNVVLGGNGYSAYNLGLLLDPFETDRSRRFKGLCTHYKIGADCDRSVYVTSGDGIHWKVEPTAPQFGWYGPLLDDVTLLSVQRDEPDLHRQCPALQHVRRAAEL